LLHNQLNLQVWDATMNHSSNTVWSITRTRRIDLKRNKKSPPKKTDLNLL
jgi:hypothetical protein